jgi:hypothetical protein
MENNYQEKILNKYVEMPSRVLVDTIVVIRDCFAITRIQDELLEVGKAAAFNSIPRAQMIQKLKELNSILSKYPNAVEQIKIEGE